MAQPEQKLIKPTIGIIGAGAIGAFYGGMLARAGHTVHFLVRSDFAAVRDFGWTIDSQVYGLCKVSVVDVYQSIADMPQCDWIFVAAKTTSNRELAPLLSQIAAPGATVVLLQNGFNVEEDVRSFLPPSVHLMGGLCFICVHRQAPGVIVHEAFGRLGIGYHSGPVQTAETVEGLVQRAVGLFAPTTLPVVGLDNLTQARWQKLVWNIPYNGLSVLLKSGTKALMEGTQGQALIKDLMGEVIQAAKACGHELPNAYAEALLQATLAMPDYLPSMYHDFVQGRPLELEALYEAPLQAATAVHLTMPRTKMLLQALRFVEQRDGAAQ